MWGGGGAVEHMLNTKCCKHASNVHLLLKVVSGSLKKGTTSDPLKGPLTGGPQCRMQISRVLSRVSVVYSAQTHVANLTKGWAAHDNFLTSVSHVTKPFVAFLVQETSVSPRRN